MTREEPPLLELRDVTVLRGGRPALRGASLAIGRGERVAILGPNGCGKSTLLKLLTRELYPVAAPGSSLRILGRERWNVRELRETLGIVTNDLGAALAGAGTILDVVLSGFFASYGIAANHVVTNAMRVRALAALADVGIDELASRSIDDVSSGQARRALVARALAHDPASLVFDEPGTALDLRARRELFRTMRALARDGRGLIIATHDFAEIVPEIDRVVFMRDGAFVADGPPARLLVPERVAELYGVPVARCVSCGNFDAFDTIDERRLPRQE